MPRVRRARATRLLIGATATSLALTVTTSVIASTASASSHSDAGLPVQKMNEILGAEGTASNGVLEYGITRSDLHIDGPGGVPLKDGFQIEHDVFFQRLRDGDAIVNGDFALKPSELQPVIDQILKAGLVFQAEHQHVYNYEPDTWFVHYRGKGSPTGLASDVRSVLDRTSTPLPQSSPAHPTTPLPADKLAEILGGDASVGENGVVTVTVPRKNSVELGGVRINPELNIANTIQFEPLSSNGKRAAVVPDFSMTADEINAVIKTMRGFDWEIGCLYNQETDEHPQLYFSHTWKVGDPVDLAKQVRKGLDQTNAES